MVDLVVIGLIRAQAEACHKGLFDSGEDIPDIRCGIVHYEK